MEFQPHNHLVPARALLSVRELEVWQLLCQCHSNKEIAFALGLSERTVKHHVSALLVGLRRAGRLELLRFGLEHPEELKSGSIALELVDVRQRKFA